MSRAGPASRAADGPDCQVWWCRVEEMHELATRWVSEGERQRAATYRRVEDRDRSVGAAALLRALCASRTAQPRHSVRIDRCCPHCGGPHGRPLLGDRAGHVSVSHAGQWALAAYCHDAAVGVDVEDGTAVESWHEIRPLLLGAGERTVSDGECLCLWTVKEAFLKATGDGLTREMSEVCVSGDVVTLGDMSAVGLWSALRAPRGYRASLVVLHPRPAVVVECDATHLLRACGSGGT